MSDLKSMKLTASEAKEKYSEPSTSLTNKPSYPYGLRIDLDSDALEKLGIGMLPDVGTVLYLDAKVEVCNINVYDSQDGGARKSMGLQITDMSLSKAVESEDPEKKIYGV